MNCDYERMRVVAVRVARAVGGLLRRGFAERRVVNEVSAHDVKLAMDVQAQQFIYRAIGREFPDHAFLGEEDSLAPAGPATGGAEARFRWVIDPLDGTVNYYYGIPHYCTSLACQEKLPGKRGWETVVGAIYDPSCDEMFSTRKGGPALLNGRAFRVSSRRRLADCCVTIGLFKSPRTIAYGNLHFAYLSRRARKIRIMGAAALDLAYVACGRYDAYLELSIKLWDIAAGLLLLKNAGGVYRLRPTGQPHSFECVATNGKILGRYRFFSRMGRATDGPAAVGNARQERN